MFFGLHQFLVERCPVRERQESEKKKVRSSACIPHEDFGSLADIIR
jgi:hypothetical protein